MKYPQPFHLSSGQGPRIGLNILPKHLSSGGRERKEPSNVEARLAELTRATRLRAEAQAEAKPEAAGYSQTMDKKM